MPTIAIVNDCESLRQAFAIWLRGNGFDVRHYGDTQSALELCDNPADVALVDKNNRPLGGVELFKRLRQRNAMPVIFVTPWAPEIREELEKEWMFAEGYMTTPCSMANLTDLIRDVLAVHGAN